MGNDFPMCCHTNWWDILGVRECLYVSTHARLPIKCVRVCGWVCLSHAATAVATDALVSAWIVNEPLLWVVCVKSRCAGVRLHTRIRILASDSLMWLCLDCGFSVAPQHRHRHRRHTRSHIRLCTDACMDVVSCYWKLQLLSDAKALPVLLSSHTQSHSEQWTLVHEGWHVTAGLFTWRFKNKLQLHARCTPCVRKTLTGAQIASFARKQNKNNQKHLNPSRHWARGFFVACVYEQLYCM